MRTFPPTLGPAPTVTVWGAHAFALGPLIALVAIGSLVIVLRWAFSGRNTSLIAPAARKGSAFDYGLLTPIAEPASQIEAAIWREALAAEGIRCTVASTTDGARVMVFSRDAVRARAVISQTRGR